MKNTIGFDFDDMLDAMGLQRRRSSFGFVLPMAGLVIFGAILGASAGLMLAPSSGRRLRRDVTERLDQLRERMKQEKQKKQNSAANAVAQG